MNESLFIWRKFKNLKEEAIVLREIGIAHYLTKKYEVGLKYSKESMDISLKIDDPVLINHCLMQLHGIMTAYHFLGDCAMMDGAFQIAEREYVLGIEVSLKSDEIWVTCIDIQGVVVSVGAQSRLPKSIRLDASVREKARVAGFTLPSAIFWEELTWKYEDEGIAMGFENAVEYALNFDED